MFRLLLTKSLLYRLFVMFYELLLSIALYPVIGQSVVLFILINNVIKITAYFLYDYIWIGRIRRLK